jgi:2',3'-cyclic-nucleotide 2'-phosphodiesterase (5'-nucleotidase family)
VDILCANVRHASDGELLFPAYKIACVGDARIGIVGLLGSHAFDVIDVGLRAGLRLDPPLDAARAACAQLALEGVDAVVCLSHDGVRNGADRHLAATGLFDVLFSGHEHTELELSDGDDGWIMVPNGRPNGLGGTLLHPGWWGGQAVARAELHIDGTARGRFCGYATATDVLDASSPEDEETVQWLDGFQRRVRAVSDEVVGELPRALPKGRDFAANDALARWVGSALIGACRSAGARADVALITDGSVRAGLPAGPVTWGAVDSVWPWRGTPVVVELRGSLLLSLLAKSTDRSRGDGTKQHAFGLHVAEVVEVVEDARAAAGEVVAVRREGDGRRLREDEWISVVLPDPYPLDTLLPADEAWAGGTAARARATPIDVLTREVLLAHLRKEGPDRAAGVPS